jgi:hypothetical protein
MAKQAKLHKNTVRKKNRRIKKKKCVIEKLREEMKKYQEQTMRGIGVLKEKHDEAKQQRDEATELLVEAKEERDEAKEDFDILNNKVDKIVNHIVPPAIRHSKSENCIVFKIPRTTKSKKISDFRRRKDNQLPQYMDYYVSCCQSYSVDGVKERIMKKHGAKPIIIKKMKPSPNSKNIFHRFQEKYGATLAKSKKAKKPVVYNYNYVGLYGTTTEADIIRFLDEAKEERDEVLTNLSDLNNKVDNIVDTIVPPCQRTSKTENCIIFKIPRNENSKKVLDCYQRKDNKLPEFMDYYVTCCQIRANESVKNKLRRKHGVNPTILKQLTPSPNSKNIYHRFQDKYGAKVSKTKNTKKKIVYNRNYIGLYDTTTEADMLRFLDEVEAEKEFRDEIVV